MADGLYLTGEDLAPSLLTHGFVYGIPPNIDHMVARYPSFFPYSFRSCCVCSFSRQPLRGGGVDDGVVGDEVRAFLRAQAKMMLSFLDAGIYISSHSHSLILRTRDILCPLDAR